jgi:uncharacterized protein (DUF1800 family)
LTLAQDQLAHIAFNRFGLGAKPGGVGRIRRDAKAAVVAELETPNIAQITEPGLPTYAQAFLAVHTDFSIENGMKERELSARIAQHMQPEIGFVERLVLFFSNHFSMSVNKDGAIRATIGQLERSVIRKHVLGSFENMLLGVIRHPAMLKYLDNDDSIGPNSIIGKSWGVGLNHNLAREIFELHALGVGGGYTEADIAGLARALTGWSFVRGWEADGRYNGGDPTNRGRFIFRPDWHEPGPQTILGQSYADTGVTQAIDALRAIARHPSTAQFIAFKLVRHFIVDDPTPELVDPVAAAFRNSRGNLKVVARALIDLPQAWTLPLKKLRTPYELEVAKMRAMQRVYNPQQRWPFDSALDALRHKPWEHPTPDGFSDESVYWMGPDAMRIRVETAQLSAWALQQVAPRFSHGAPNLASALFASVLSNASLQGITAATNRDDGLTMLFMSPEFQRR